MSTTDGCNCGNTCPPDACIPSATPGMAYRCHYRCGDCGNTWTRAYAKAVAPQANRQQMCDNEDGPGGAGNTTRSLTHSSDQTREGLAS